MNKRIGTSLKKISILSVATLCVGVIAGLAGTFLALLLHATQHIAYDYSLNAIVSPESFLDGVTAASPQRRLIVLFICGLIAGLGWYSLMRFSQPLVSITNALKKERPLMPLGTVFNDLLQIVTVALGSPLGREVAPRELAAYLTGCFTKLIKLEEKESRTLFACAAGAGLAAVYNVPLGGAFFTMEVLLNDFKIPVLLPALLTSVLAVFISWIGLGNEPIYHLATLHLNGAVIVWACLCGPIFGACAFLFSQLVMSARGKAPKNKAILWLCLFNFIFIGVLAMYFPALLGNGRSPTQLEFTGAASVQLTLILLLLRTLIVWSSLRAGAQGGLLTPSLANGALLGVLLGFISNYLFHTNIQLSAFAIIGAVSFLAAVQNMPLTAIILIFELTHLSIDFLPAIILGVISTMSFYLLIKN